MEIREIRNRALSLLGKTPAPHAIGETGLSPSSPNPAVEVGASGFGPPVPPSCFVRDNSIPLASGDPLNTAAAGTYQSALGPAHRIASLERLENEVQDVLVVGGGVTGAGVALDAASRGLKVGLVESQDLAAGTSSRSSKLIHGGLRYLEQLNFGLVAEAIKERALLLDKVGPHLVQPVPFLFPLTKRVVERPYVGAGVALYDLFDRFAGEGMKERLRSNKAVPWHKHLTRTQALEQAPGLKKEALIGAIQYSDAQVDDARFTLGLARTAAKHGAAIATSTEVKGFLMDGDRVVGATVVDKETGREFNIRAKHVVNATGVWSEDVQGLAGGEKEFQIRASKGIHLIVPKDRIDSDTGIILRTEKSVLFIIPWEGQWLVGTTDTEYKLHNKEHPAVSQADIDYVLEHANAVLKTPLSKDDIVGSFAGLRPLVSAGDGDTTKLSREHLVSKAAPGLTAIAGGKYTTYRVMAKDAVDAAVEGIGRPVPPSRTEDIPLVGGEGFAEKRAQRDLIAQTSGLSPAQVDHLLSRYGAEIDTLLEMIANRPELGQPLPGAPGTLQVEALFAVLHEGALHLDDVLARRTRVAIQCPDRGAAAAEPVARLMAEVLGWDEPKLQSEVSGYRARVEAELKANEQPDDLSADSAHMAVERAR